MKKRKYPIHKSCEHFDYCAGEKGHERNDCGYCPLHPRAARIFTPTFVLQLILQILLYFLLGAFLMSKQGAAASIIQGLTAF